MASRPKNVMADYAGNKEKEALFERCVEHLVFKQKQLSMLKREIVDFTKEHAVKLNIDRAEIIDEVRFRSEV